MSVSVFQDWLLGLTMQQQSVLVLACRGPDGIAKFHPTKLITTRYRAAVLKQAYSGRAMHIDDGVPGNTFMSLEQFSSKQHWTTMVLKNFFNHVDELPHHYYMHLMHGAQILGYKHPESLFRSNWLQFYQTCCSDLHLNVETEEQMDTRLSDWNRAHWD